MQTVQNILSSMNGAVMLLTTSEANEKYCPFGKASDGDSMCQGSQCAMWRLSEKEQHGSVMAVIEGRNEEQARKSIKSVGGSVPDSWKFDAAIGKFDEPLEEFYERALGFCGMAGVPNR